MIEQRVEIFIEQQGHVMLMRKVNDKVAELNKLGWIVIGMSTETSNGMTLSLLFQKGNPEYTLRHEMPVSVAPFTAPVTPSIDPYTGAKS